MKASFVVMLLTLCLCARAAESPFFENALSFQKPKGALTVALDSKSRHVLNSVSTQNTSHPYLKVDFFHKRTGSGTVVHYTLSVEECIQICRKHIYSCLAINYHRGSRACYELKSLGQVVNDASYATSLVNYKDGDDPCDDVYSLKGFSHEYFVYDLYSGVDAPSAKNCCLKCREDPQSRRPLTKSPLLKISTSVTECKVWSYDTRAKYCWLQDAAPPLSTMSTRITGFSVVDSYAEADAS